MWTKNTANAWNNYFPPNRPSNYELAVCARYITEIRRTIKRKPRLLVLGSTTEYRTLGVEENCDVTIIDNSIEYHSAISKELKYLRAKETIVISNWQNMKFFNEFDMIVGDLVIGNMHAREIDNFLENIRRALTRNGIFITKSFFYNRDREILHPSSFFKTYEDKYSYYDPFPFNAYNLSVYSMNRNSFVLKFTEMFDVVLKSFFDGFITEKTLNRYKELGWEEALNTEFYMMPKDLWEFKLKSVFDNYIIEYASCYFWSEDFPFYIIQSKQVLEFLSRHK
ncbi:class I SAM-dependent methyltransferase [Ereboglobus luteus]|nr:class I SAM-dependent methyltransferase [Ereboglobus luteus]